jgi:HAMP domain-containing protein
VAKGDLSSKITVDVKGEILELKKHDQYDGGPVELICFGGNPCGIGSGYEGKLGGQAKVQDVGGTWKDLTESVNQMASNLTAQVRNIADVTTAVAMVTFPKKITVNVAGEILGVEEYHQHDGGPVELIRIGSNRVALEVGTEGNWVARQKCRVWVVPGKT